MRTNPWDVWGVLVLLAVCGTVLSACSKPTEPLDGAPVPPIYSADRPDKLPRRLAIPTRSIGDHLLVPAAVNGVDGGMFLLDTGAAMDAIGLGLAGRLQLPMEGLGRARGVGGVERFRYRPIDSLSIAGLELPTRRIAGINLSGFGRSIGTSVNGVIGYGSLRHAPFTLDYRHDTLTVYRPATFTPPEGAAAIPYRVIGGVPRIQVDLGRGRRVWVIVDTGADTEVTLPISVAKRWPDIVGVPVNALGQSRGVGGGVSHTSTWLKSIKVLGVELQLVPVNLEQVPPGASEVGRIGHRLLHNFELTFDPRRNVIYAKFQPET